MSPRSTPKTEGPDRGLTTFSNRASAAWQSFRRTRPYRTFSRFTDVGGPVLSAGMGFQALFAIFAALLVGFGILAISTRENLEFIEIISDLINTYVPGLISTSTQTGEVSLGDLLNQRALDWTSLIAGISLIWVSMTWFTSTRRSIRLMFGLDVKEYRGWILLKVRDFVGAVAVFLAIIVSASLTIISSGLFTNVLDFFSIDTSSWIVDTLGTVASYGLMFLADTLIIMGMHRFLAEIRVPFWPLVKGSILGAIGLFGLKVLADVVLGGATSNPLLATFAVFVALLLWFNLLSRVLLLTSAWIATGRDLTLGID